MVVFISSTVLTKRRFVKWKTNVLQIVNVAVSLLLYYKLVTVFKIIALECLIGIGMNC